MGSRIQLRLWVEAADSYAWGLVSLLCVCASAGLLLSEFQVIQIVDSAGASSPLYVIVSAAIAIDLPVWLRHACCTLLAARSCRPISRHRDPHARPSNVVGIACIFLMFMPSAGTFDAW